MMDVTVVRKIEQLRVVPVVAIDDAAHADSLGEALVRGGLPCAEITFRTAAAEQSIRTLARRSDFLLGAGTVLTVEMARKALAAGARFIVSPGLNPKVVEYCLRVNVPVFPGVATPTEIEMALNFRLKVVKFFPAEAYGGLKTIKAIAAPYRDVRFIPTGGISAENLKEYLSFKAILACGGTWFVKPELINAGQFDQIEKLTRQAVELAR